MLKPYKAFHPSNTFIVNKINKRMNEYLWMCVFQAHICSLEPAYRHTETSSIAQQEIVWNVTCHNKNFVATNCITLPYTHTLAQSFASGRFKAALLPCLNAYSINNMCVIYETVLVLSSFATGLWQTRKFCGFEMCKNLNFFVVCYINTYIFIYSPHV